MKGRIYGKSRVKEEAVKKIKGICGEIPLSLVQLHVSKTEKLPVNH